MNSATNMARNESWGLSDNWFLYWKTTTSLWRQKLSSIPGRGPVIVPINWSFHSETGDQYDFARVRPETDLKKIVEIVEDLGRDVVFFLPLGPVPFLPNGGIPHLLARSLALDTNGMVYGILDADRKINKFFSFFDTRVFHGFTLFVKNLGEYFSSNGIASTVWGMESGFLHNQRYVSYLHDRSKTFERAFSKYLTIQKEENQLESVPRDNHGVDSAWLIDSQKEEQVQMVKFSDMIKKLYEDAAREALAGNWEGRLKVAFIGGGQHDFFTRILGGDSLSGYSTALFESIGRDIFPSAILLPEKNKKGVLGRQLNDLIFDSSMAQKLRPSLYEEEGRYFSSLFFFELFEKDEGLSGVHWKKNGLLSFLEQRYKWVYKIKLLDENIQIDDEQSNKRLMFFDGAEVDKQHFNTLLKIFMNGGRVILDRSKLSGPLLKRLELFFIENSIEIQRINHPIFIENATLGEGRIISFDGDRLSERTQDEQSDFWERLFLTFDILHMSVMNEEGVDAIWRTRSASPHELRYEEIRRLGLYNKTSYKKRIKVPVKRHFALTKVVDDINARISSSPQSIEVELLPDGSCSIDFGIFY